MPQDELLSRWWRQLARACDLRHLDLAWFEALATLWRRVLNNTEVPTAWYDIRVIGIPKVDDPSSLRPLAIAATRWRICVAASVTDIGRWATAWVHPDVMWGLPSRAPDEQIDRLAGVFLEAHGTIPGGGEFGRRESLRPAPSAALKQRAGGPRRGQEFHEAPGALRHGADTVDRSTRSRRRHTVDGMPRPRTRSPQLPDETAGPHVGLGLLHGLPEQRRADGLRRRPCAVVRREQRRRSNAIFERWAGFVDNIGKRWYVANHSDVAEALQRRGDTIPVEMEINFLGVGIDAECDNRNADDDTIWEKANHRATRIRSSGGGWRERHKESSSRRPSLTTAKPSS